MKIEEGLNTGTVAKEINFIFCTVIKGNGKGPIYSGNKIWPVLEKTRQENFTVTWQRRAGEKIRKSVLF